MKIAALVALAAICLGAVDSFGKDTPKTNPFKSTLSSVPSAELPARAADLVKSARARERETTTIDVVKAGVGINPGAAAPIVGAIARAVPEMAAVAAGTAAAEQPKQASAIVKAAASAAPAKAGKIVSAVCTAVPNDYRSVAVAAAEVAPTSSKEILRSVEIAVPDLKPYIDRELAGYGLTVPPVAETLDQAQAALSRTTQLSAAAIAGPAPSASGTPTASASPTLSRGAGSGPPYVPPSDPNSNGSRPSPGTGDSSSGGRDYSRP